MTIKKEYNSALKECGFFFWEGRKRPFGVEVEFLKSTMRRGCREEAAWILFWGASKESTFYERSPWSLYVRSTANRAIGLGRIRASCESLARSARSASSSVSRGPTKSSSRGYRGLFEPPHPACAHPSGITGHVQVESRPTRSKHEQTRLRRLRRAERLGEQADYPVHILCGLTGL